MPLEPPGEAGDKMAEPEQQMDCKDPGILKPGAELCDPEAV